jgi:hypothetical protein
MYLACYLRHGDKVFETYWTTRAYVPAVMAASHLLTGNGVPRKNTAQQLRRMPAILYATSVAGAQK